MYNLGPTGYPFERFIARVLDADGYETRVDQIVPGRCVEHEVDVVAKKDNTCYMIECKFHHTPSTLSNVKTALYVQARFVDIREAGIMCTSKKNMDHKGMLVTNTRFSGQAIQYAECIGLNVLAWKYPQGRSLEQLIDQHRTYPVTVIPAVTRTNVGALLKNDIVLARDVHQMSEDAFVRATGLQRSVASRIYRQACTACG
jgi:Holliday junction resolvase